MKSAAELMTCKNVVSTNHTYSNDLGRELKSFVLVEPTVDEWNRKAEIQNTKMFHQKFGRGPKDYGEVLKWIYSFVEPQYIPEHHKEAVSI